MLDIINEPFLLYSYAWCTNLAMETGKNWSRPSACLPCSVLIGLWSPELPKSCLEGVTLSFVWWRRRTKSVMSVIGRPGKIRRLLLFYQLPALSKMGSSLVWSIPLLLFILNSPEIEMQSHFINKLSHVVYANHPPFLWLAEHDIIKTSCVK
jgi:hypothetical protein